MVTKNMFCNSWTHPHKGVLHESGTNHSLLTLHRGKTIPPPYQNIYGLSLLGLAQFDAHFLWPLPNWTLSPVQVIFQKKERMFGSKEIFECQKLNLSAKIIFIKKTFFFANSYKNWNQIPIWVECDDKLKLIMIWPKL